MSRAYLRQDGNRENHTPAPPFIRIGRSIRYVKEGLDLWLDALPKYQRHNHFSYFDLEWSIMTTSFA
jgi:hypothetical protein